MGSVKCPLVWGKEPRLSGQGRRRRETLNRKEVGFEETQGGHGILKSPFPRKQGNRMWGDEQGG